MNILNINLIRRVFLLSIFLFGFSCFTFADEEKSSIKKYVYTNFTTLDGLPSNEVYCVFQDSKGFIWMGTDRGVTKYDGYEFKTYTTEDGLTDNVIFDIAEDSTGKLWFTTSNQTLFCYSSQKGFYPFKFNSLINNCIQEKHLGYSYILDKIFIDTNDNLFLSSYHMGYLKISLKRNNVIDNQLKDIQQLLLGDIDLISDSEFNLVITPLCYLGESGHSTVKRNGKFYDHVWFESYYRTKNWNQRSYFINDSVFTIGSSIYTMEEDSITVKKYSCNLHVFKVGNQYLVNQIFDNKKGKVLLVDDLNKMAEGQVLLHNPIRLTKSTVDKNGGYWLSSLEQGVFYVPSLKAQSVDEHSNVAILYPYDEGVFYGERNTNFSYYEDGDVGPNSIKNTSLDKLPKTLDHSIKLSHQVTFEEYDIWKNSYDYPASNQIEGFVIKNDTLFFAVTRMFGLYDKNTKKGKYISSINKRIKAFELGEGHFMFVGNADGIYKVDYRRVWDRSGKEYYDNFEPYIKLNIIPKDIKWIENKRILAVATSGNGVLIYKGDQLLKKITYKEGLVSNTVNQLFLDSTERLWIGTNRGINYLEIDNNDSIYVKNYMASSRSLLSPNVQQLYLIEDSLLYVGTDKGLNEFNISELNENQKRYFPIFITKTLVNESFSLRSELEYDENNLEIYFTAIEFNRFGNINYRYRLKGLSNNWIYTKERKATFLQVNPGEYQFELEAQNEKGEWIRASQTNSFIILKPYWKTWWFIGGISLLIILIVGGALYYYISNLKKEKEFIEDKQILSEELNESRQKALSAQLNPHFVFNSLNSIQNFILTKRTELSSDYLSMFSKLMRFVFENSKKLYVPLSDEIEALRLYLELEQVRHNHKFKYKISAEGVKPETVFIPSLLVQPMIENAIWHGLLHKKEDNCLLEVVFRSEGSHLRIEVKDNGVGRRKSNPRPRFIKKQRSSGVELTKQRLDLLSQSTGLSTVFEIVDLFDDNKLPCGTLVILTIPINLKNTI